MKAGQRQEKGERWHALNRKEHALNINKPTHESENREQKQSGLQGLHKGDDCGPLEDGRSSVACKEIALSTIEFRRTETTKEMRKEKRDDQCGSQKRHEEVDAVNEQKKATTACIELKRTCKDHQQKA